ncbi:MAG: UDP-N-acetylmuramate dehydrogenase [Acidobacteriota bacterium]|nr:UDP-N-acetylmuramate dehydrogenase [Acidobacteriota bacterium]
MMAALDCRRLAADLGIRVEAEYPLARLTTLNVGGPAEWVFFPQTAEQAATLYGTLRGSGTALRFIGGGSNIIAPDTGVRGAVICTAQMTHPPQDIGGDRFRCSAGQAIPGLARWAAKAGRSGVEFAEGIPAQLGGALRMNAGANESCFAEITEAVWLADGEGGMEEHPVVTGDFAYRQSFIARRGCFVVGAVLRLAEDDPAAIRERMLTFRRRRQASQPLSERSAGCVFANYPDQSVGALIEELGLKGLRIGAAEVSRIHGNFIVNRGGAPGRWKCSKRSTACGRR